MINPRRLTRRRGDGTRGVSLDPTFPLRPWHRVPLVTFPDYQFIHALAAEEGTSVVGARAHEACAWISVLVSVPDPYWRSRD